MTPLKVEIWSDVVCPWCYIGKRRFEAALNTFKHKDQVEISWKSFQLDPGAPQSSDQTLNEMLAEKYGMGLQKAAEANERVTRLAALEGLDYHLEEAHPANTFKAHRLIHFAASRGLQAEMKERLMQAYFAEAQRIGDTETLVKLAVETGLDEAETRKVLEADTYSDEVRADIQEAGILGITGVPFFVLDGKYGVSGAQPAEVFTKVLEQVWAESHPLVSLGTLVQDGESCEGDSCQV